MASLPTDDLARAHSWEQDTPVPRECAAQCRLQSWHAYDDSTRSWIPKRRHQMRSECSQTPGHGQAGFGIVTWNMDAMAPAPQKRADGIVNRILGLGSAVDVVFLQEVSHPALAFILADGRIRGSWYLSDAEKPDWGGHPFGTITLVSQRRFDGPAALGHVWRVRYASRFGRDGLCCDIFAPAPDPEQASVRVRLVNVHLDSLAIEPSHRPRQLRVVASLLRSAGRGVVAGDFNPVLPEDKTLVEASGLTDAWARLHGHDPGFTWGIDGKQPFPPGRLDKVATMEMEAETIQILYPGSCEGDWPEAEPWSDHCGLWCQSRLPP